jgi:uncharacterized protein
VMLADSFHIEVPSWVSPIATFVIVGFFLWKSLGERRRSSSS